MKHIFIINPTAGKTDSRQKIYDMAESLRQKHGLDVQCILTKSRATPRSWRKALRDGRGAAVLRLRRRRDRQRGGQRHYRL